MNTIQRAEMTRVRDITHTTSISHIRLVYHTYDWYITHTTGGIILHMIGDLQEDDEHNTEGRDDEGQGYHTYD